MRAVAFVLASGLASAVATIRDANAAPGDLLVSEASGGSVLELGTGGDLSMAPRFATGLSAPLGICVGPGGEIYAAESAAGEITIITDGGDFTDAAPFAFGPFQPSGLLCDDELILVTDPLLGLVVDASAGGNLAQHEYVRASGLPLPVGLARHGEVTYCGNGDVFDITFEGDFASASPYAFGRTLLPLVTRDDTLLGGSFDAPEIYDLTAGGDLSASMPFAVLPAADGAHVDGLLDAGELGLFALSADCIYEVGDGGDLGGAEPFASGLLTGQLGYQGMVHHVCSSSADCDDADACNGVEECTANACIATNVPDCDDGSLCTADSCDAASGCAHDPIAGCCSSDLDCATDEICDDADHVCVPAVVPPAADTGSESTSEGGSDDASVDPTSDGSDGSESSGSEPQADAHPPGCGCTAPGGFAPSAIVYWLFALARRRRR